MTQTDKAFVRAYQQEVPAVEHRPAPPEPIDVINSVHASVPLESMVHSVDVHTTSTFPIAGQPEPAANQTDAPAVGQRWRFDTPADRTENHPAPSPATPHAKFVDPTIQQPAASPVTRSASVSDKQPLASFVSSRTEPTDRFRAGTTVAKFRMPPVCRKLIDQHLTEIQPAVEAILASADEGRSLVGIGSCSPQTGCTTLLLCLAQQLASYRRSVVMVDGRFAKPALATWLRIEPDTTWYEVLHHGAPITEALVRSESDGLTVLPYCAGPATSLPTSGGTTCPIGLQASSTAGAVRYAYDVALLDLGPLAAPEHGRVARELVDAMRLDAVCLVCDPTRDSDVDRQKAIQLLSQANCKTLGIIENFAPTPP